MRKTTRKHHRKGCYWVDKYTVDPHWRRLPSQNNKVWLVIAPKETVLLVVAVTRQEVRARVPNAVWIGIFNPHRDHDYLPRSVTVKSAQ